MLNETMSMALFTLFDHRTDAERDVHDKLKDDSFELI